MNLSVKKISQGNKIGKMKVADKVFVRDFNEPLIHQAVVTYLAGARQGSKAQKKRSMVRGGGIKPWRQKGTGRARAGTRSSPIWRSGGVTFAASPRSFDKKMNRKMYKGALCSILSELVRAKRLVVVDDLQLAEPKTKLLTGILKSLDLHHVLIISGEVSANLYLAARNVPNVGVIEAQMVDPVALVSYEKILATKSAVKQLEERFA